MRLVAVLSKASGSVVRDKQRLSVVLWAYEQESTPPQGDSSTTTSNTTSTTIQHCLTHHSLLDHVYDWGQSYSLLQGQLRIAESLSIALGEGIQEDSPAVASFVQMAQPFITDVSILPPTKASKTDRLAGFWSLQSETTQRRLHQAKTTKDTTHLSSALCHALDAFALWNEPITTIQSGKVDYMVLDHTAQAAVHLFSSSAWGTRVDQGGTTTNASVFGLLSQPLQLGHSLLESWLRQPLIDLSKLQARQEAVTYFCEHAVERNAVRSVLPSSDLYQLAAQLEIYAVKEDNEEDRKGNSSTRQALETLYKLYQVGLQTLPLVVEQLQTLQDVPELLQNQVIQPLYDTTTCLARAVDLASQVLDLDAAPRDFLVQTSYAPDLEDWRCELSSLQEQQRTCHQQMQNDWTSWGGEGDIRLETSDDTWTFRLPDTNASKLLQAHKIPIVKMLKNGVYFTTKTLSQLSTAYQDALQAYDVQQRQVARSALQVASTYAAPIRTAATSLALVDVLAGLAHTACHRNYCRPQLTDNETGGGGRRMELKEARHPCVEAQEGMEFIPNDVELTAEQVLLVTGPNSTYQMQIGFLIVIYTHTILFFNPYSGRQIDVHSCCRSHLCHGADWFLRTVQ